MGRSESGMKVRKGGGRTLPPAPPHPIRCPAPGPCSRRSRAFGAALSFAALPAAALAHAPRVPDVRRFQPPYIPDPPEQAIRVPLLNLTFTPLTSSDRHE